jgi:hypothetical protein
VASEFGTAGLTNVLRIMTPGIWRILSKAVKRP